MQNKKNQAYYFSQRESLNNSKMLSIPNKILECMFVPFSLNSNVSLYEFLSDNPPTQH